MEELKTEVVENESLGVKGVESDLTDFALTSSPKNRVNVGAVVLTLGAVAALGVGVVKSVKWIKKKASKKSFEEVLEEDESVNYESEEAFENAKEVVD